MEMAKTKSSFCEDGLRRRAIPIDDNTWDKVVRMADKYRISASSLVRVAIIEKLDREAQTQAQLR